MISVSGVLLDTSKVPDILWIFSHYAPEPRKPEVSKRYLTLAKNPHFYDGPPKFPTSFMDTHKTPPTNDYQGTIYVLTNNECRVFLDSGDERWTFDNVWKTSNTVIFKGSCSTVTICP